MVALEGTMRYLEGWYAISGNLLGSFAKGQGLSLGQQIGHQQVVVIAEGIERLAEANEVAGDQPGALVNELVEGVLAVGAGLTPDDRAGLVVDAVAFQVHMLAIAFHIELLEVSAQAVEILVIRQDRPGLRAEEVIVPDAQQGQDHRQITLEGRGTEMLVHLVEARQHLIELFWSHPDHHRDATSTI